MKCRLLTHEQLEIRPRVKPPRTLRSARNLIIYTAFGRASGLNSNMPLPTRQEVGDGDKNVTSGTPKVLYDVVLGPLISYSNLVYRVDVLDQL